MCVFLYSPHAEQQNLHYTGEPARIMPAMPPDRTSQTPFWPVLTNPEVFGHGFKVGVRIGIRLGLGG